MLTWLQIKQFAIADQIEIEFSDGLSVITGETGAGKSILINALALVLGQRAESSVVKHGHQRAEIQANFDIADNPVVKSLLQKLSLDEDNECQLRRVINVDSGSKAYLNGRMVTAGVLRQVGLHLLDIHGQHEHQSLLRSDTQRELLDSFAGITDQVTELREGYQQLHQAVEQLGESRREAASASEKFDFLQYQVDELDRFAPQADEWAGLHANHQRIHHQSALAASVQVAEQQLFGGHLEQSCINTQLSHVIAELDKVQAYEPVLGEVSKLLQEAQTLIVESEYDLRRVGEAIAFDEDELDAIEQRYAAYMNLARKHRVEPEQLYSTWQALREQLEKASNPAEHEQVLLKQIHSHALAYHKLATSISEQRRQAAQKLSAAVSEAMQTLAMEGGNFTAQLQPVTPAFDLADCAKDLPTIGREYGYEQTSFHVSTNRGMPGKPLAQIASGGEISRISLALQLILSDVDSINTLVFDEVDVGVGGKTAAVIGKMLAQLGSSRQIICITHLPQVAAYGAHHYHVNKQQGEQVQLEVIQLDEAHRIEEIARMAGGERINDESLAHARSLLASSRH